jgi:Ser/Thr protein kinase RdoA (MazF antagonist)
MLNLSHQPPAFTEQDAQRFALEYYGIQARARALPSEHDQNFALETEASEAFVLKIARAGETFEVLDLQNKTLEHLAARAPELLVPRVLRAAEGELIARARGADETPYSMRLLRYIPGKALAHTAPHTPELLHQLGQTLGALDLALRDFTHPAMQRVLKWDVQRANWIGDYLHCIDHPGTARTG